MPTIPGYADFVEVGRGGFAVVYRARQETVDREVAVKVISERGADQTAVLRFKQECRAAGTLSWHPHIVVVYDAGVTADGFPFLSMEYLSAGSLEDRLEKEGPLSWSSAATLTLQVADALHTAHIADTLHRDLKPANILIGRSGQAKLADFGIVSIAGVRHTRTGEFMATVAYAAPEILSGDPASEAADQYSLAATLHTLIAGVPAFVKHTDESIGPIVMRTLSEDPPNLAERGLPGPVNGVIRRAMAKAPTDRFPSVEAFASALRNAMQLAGSAVESGDRPSASASSRTTSVARKPPPVVGSNERAISASKGRRRLRFSKAAARVLIVAMVLIGGSTTAWLVGNGGDSNELTVGVSEPEREDKEAVAEEGHRAANSVRVGDCFDDPGNLDDVEAVPAVPCDQPHANEAYHAFDIEVDGDEFPGAEQIEQLATDGCLTEFQAFVGTPYDESSLDIFYLAPSASSWEDLDDREVLCAVYDRDGESLTGRAEASEL